MAQNCAEMLEMLAIITIFSFLPFFWAFNWWYRKDLIVCNSTTNISCLPFSFITEKSNKRGGRKCFVNLGGNLSEDVFSCFMNGFKKLTIEWNLANMARHCYVTVFLLQKNKQYSEFSWEQLDYDMSISCFLMC